MRQTLRQTGGQAVRQSNKTKSKLTGDYCNCFAYAPKARVYCAAVIVSVLARHSAVGTATRYGLDGMGLNHSDARFSVPAQIGQGPTQPPVQCSGY